MQTLQQDTELALARVRGEFERLVRSAPDSTAGPAAALASRVLVWLGLQGDRFWTRHSHVAPSELVRVACAKDERSKVLAAALRDATSQRGPELAGRAGAMVRGARARLAELRAFDLRHVDAALAVYDAVATSWARRHNSTREQWWETHIAGFHVGGTHRDTDLGFRPGQAIKGCTAFLASGLAMVYAFESADPSTLSHEAAHLFRRDLEGRDLYLAESWLGVRGGRWDGDAWIGGVWTTDEEERFARAFERYLAEGVSPTPELRPVFETMKQRLLSIYLRIEGSEIDVELPPAARQVFARLLGADAPRPERTDDPGARTRPDETTSEPDRRARAIEGCPVCARPAIECGCGRPAPALSR